MAEQKATLIVKLKDEVTAGLNKIKTSIAGLKESFLAIVTAATAVGVAIYSTLKAYAENETAVNKLNIALVKQGITSNQVSLELQRYAQALQLTTVYSDEEIMRAQALMVSFGLTGKALERTTKAALDLSSAMGVDLQTAAMLLGKAYQGNTQILARYGIAVDQTKFKSQQFNDILHQIELRMGGSASAAAQTFEGRVKILGNQIDELKEIIGAQLLPAAEKFVNFLTTLSINVGKTTNEFGIFGTVLALIINTIRIIVNTLYDIAQQIPVVGRAFKETFQNDFNNEVDKTLAMIADLHKETEKPIDMKINVPVEPTKNAFRAIDTDVQAHMVSVKKIIDVVSKDIASSFSTAVGDMLFEGKSFAESITKAFKDMAKQIIMDIVRMEIEWMIWMSLRSSFGGPFAFLGGYASGGTVYADKPTMAIFGEAGPEIATFTPVSGIGGGSTQTKGGGSSVGNVYVNVSGVNDPRIIAAEVGHEIIKAIRGQGQISFTKG